MSFKDHFSTQAQAYAEFRPRYPAALVEYLARLAPGTNVAWDCGCGSGQLSTALAERFDHVIATDASAKQIANAIAHAGVAYRVAAAEESGLPNACADLITVAQAAHWFDLPRFYAEAKRVAKDKGVLALVVYQNIEIENQPKISGLLHEYYWKVSGPYWPPERKHVEEGGRNLYFPFAELPAPDLAIEVEWDLREFLGYVSTWSATAALVRAEGPGPFAKLSQGLAELWGEAEMKRAMRWPIAVRAARISNSDF